MKSIILITALLSQAVLAETVLPALPPFVDAPENPVKIEEPADPSCEQIIPRLEKYSKDINKHHQAVFPFLDHVAGTAGKWQELLFPLERQTTEIPADYFITLQTASSGIEKITSYAYDNTAYFAKELDKIVMALKNCKL